MLKRKSVRRAYLFWLLGIGGLPRFHRFYLHKKKTAAVWIVMPGLLGFGALADFFFKMVSKTLQHDSKTERAAKRVIDN